MKNSTNYLLILCTTLLFTLLSCNNNDELISKYEEIKTQITDVQYEDLLQNFDAKSKAYIELLADTTQLNYDNLKAESKKYDLEHFSINYLFEFSGFNDSDSKYNALFLYFRLKGIPLFELLTQHRLLEDETKTGSENYVTIARKVADKTYVTSKIKFSKEDGEYKLNFLDLLTKQEKSLALAVKKYKKKFAANIPDEIRNNPDIDSTKRRDYLYTYMHYSRKDDYTPTGYYYKKSAEKRRAIK